MKPITVLLVDDHAFLRKELREFFKAAEDIKVVGEAKNGREAVELTLQLQPAVVVMDLALPLLNGLEATRRILKTFPSAKVIIFSDHDDNVYVKQATQTGAVGFVLKQASPSILFQAIREVQAGHLYFSRRRQPPTKRRNPVCKLFSAEGDA